MRWTPILVLLFALGLLDRAEAGAPAHLPEAVEGQRGLGPAVWSPDGRQLAATRWDRSGLLVVDLGAGEERLVSADRGAGFAPAWSGDALWFKDVTGDRLQRVRRLDLGDGRLETVEKGPRVGQPHASAGGAVAWTAGDALVLDDALVELYGYCNLVALDPGAQRVAFNHPDGSVGVLDLSTRDVLWVTGPGAYSHPSWSPDGERLLIRAPGDEFLVVDPRTGDWIARVQGTHPAWAPDGRTVVFERIVAAAFEVLGSDLWSFAPGSDRLTRLTSTARHERYPSISPGGDRLAFVDTTTGELLVAPRRADGSPGPAEAVLAPHALEFAAPPPPPTTRSVVVEMPYMHQLWDTPDDFNGSWSCGPTSCVQTVQKYAKLPGHDITCSWPYTHTSPWGWYIPNEYAHNGYTYDTLGLAAGDAWVPGAHGFICRELGAAYWAYMVDFCNQHDVTSWQAGTSYSTLTVELDAGYPMVASASVIGYGHIIVIKGYDDDHSVVVNDPYGDAGSGSWGDYDGEGAVYDWPGYNNGNLTDFTVAQIFGAQGPLVEPDPEWDASWVAQDHPGVMVSGEHENAWVELANEGTSTWEPGATFLGTAGPQDRDSEFEDPNSWIGANRPATVDAATPPGEVGRFSFVLRAPDVQQQIQYDEYWQLVQEGVTWFGPTDVFFEITVMPAGAAHDPVADAGPDRAIPLGASVTLDGTHSYGTTGVILSWSWDTPDGTLDGEVADWTPATTGAHAVTLTVTDDLGNDGQDTAVVEVGGGGGGDGGCECAAHRAPRAPAAGAMLLLALLSRRWRVRS